MSLVNVLGKFGSTVVGKSVFTSTPAKYALTVSPNSSSVNIGGIDYPAVNEGTTITFELVPNKVNKFNYGTVIPYTITGIETADLVNGNLTGQFIVGTDMVRTFVIDEDAHDDSTNEIMTMTVVNPAPTNAVGLSASVYVADSSKGPPSYTLYLSGNGSTTGFVYEDIGTTVTFALRTRGVYNGTQIPYTITGININDLDAGSASLQGCFTVSSILTAGWLNDRDFPNPLPEDITYVTFNIKKDGIIEGNETMVITLSSHIDPVRGIISATEGRTAQVIIKDEITWSSWTPALSAVCSGVAFTQTRTNNYGETKTQSVLGTRAPVWSSWTPALSTIVSGATFTQTRTDLNGLCENQTQYATGNKVLYIPSLLLKGDGPNNLQNNTFLDSSTTNNSITRAGTVTQGSFSPYALNGVAYSPSIHGGSAYFPGTVANYLYLPKTVFTGIAQTTRYWTLEGWFNFKELSSTVGSESGCFAVSDYMYLLVGSNTIKFMYGIGPPRVYINATQSFATNTWYHIAASCNNGTITLYVNGSAVGSVNTNPIANSGQVSNWFYIGASDLYPYYGTLDRAFKGYISNFRISNIAVYTSNFTRPTSPVTLTSNGGATPSLAPTSGQVKLLCDFTNGGIIDSVARNNLTTVGDAKVSTTLVKYGTGAMYFNSANDKLTLPTAAVGSALDYGTGDFTIECWYNFIQIGPNNVAYIISQAVSGNNNLIFIITSTRAIGVWLGHVNLGTSASSVIPLNTWCHVALVRNGSNVNIYVDGVSVRSVTSSASIGGNMLPCINGYGHAAGYGNICYIDDIRITKAAVYTGNFTPPGSLTYP